MHIIANLRRIGMATLLIEQNVRVPLQTSDYGYMIETGDLVWEGPAVSLVLNPRVIATYLDLAKKTAA
ncbi:hypothetical protein IHE33_00480 [Mycetohabitans endofungorum]|uniref:hypothetical protein n=1 Tax=Mycetohabitans endofungorum TaxID=417203 RepID=UPI003252A5CE